MKKASISFLCSVSLFAVSLFSFGQNREAIRNSEPLPAAVPVTTPEEAEKLNESAKEHVYAALGKKEPFFRLYENSSIESIVFEGTILAASAIPDPANNDYENCLYALLIEINSVLSTSSLSNAIEQTVLINTPIMKDRTLIVANKLKQGDKVSCLCAEYEAMPQSIQEIQLSDDIQSFEHQQYYTLEIKKISSFQKNGNQTIAKREISILPIQSLPKDEKAVSARHERIQEEINRIESELTKHGGSFESWKKDEEEI